MLFVGRVVLVVRSGRYCRERTHKPYDIPILRVI